jgi:hypothetical protein
MPARIEEGAENAKALLELGVSGKRDVKKRVGVSA